MLIVNLVCSCRIYYLRLLEVIQMNESTKQILKSFDQLPESEKLQLAYEIIRRTVRLDLPPLTDEELILNAEEIFLELDKRESP